ncbi:MAG: hypothetical protein H8D67_28505 [Deltaproteobacteria bacterium]|nr:hypothetical protein [Deltaproteobacteria bacterium]
MKNLFLIDGASGTGKTDLLRYLNEFAIEAKTLHKFTTRERRKYEIPNGPLLDLELISEEDFDKLSLEYQYKYGGKRYGFSKAALEEALRSSRNVFVIVRNAKTVRKIIKQYSFINVVPVYIYTDHERVVGRLREEGYLDDEIEFRLKRLGFAFDDYLKHPELFKEIIINNSTYADYGRLIEGLLEHYSTSPEVEEDLIFVLMSFDKTLPELKDYYEAIKRSTTKIDQKLKCTRLDELPGSFPISGTAKSKIQECRLAIVDLTGNRPNVFYELGFAHGINRECVLTAHKGTPPQFYPNEYNIIYYENATDLEEQLTKHLQKILKA